MAPWIALEQMSLDTELSPVLHIHKLPLSLPVDAEFFAPFIDDLQDGYCCCMRIFLNVE
jgi:hypothetical protein